ncbi:hypothetical protein HELRODRAFT_95427 [Helobdella robusta]|uniref:Transcription termination factor 2 n=1 Tax=Helobdella robusta TaxID=6412 RepID=T1G959_HELRO|nr:hypothetical protein HELRODRAFT_95427 [Helobdella robusta]ESN96427.1 hypothetical protein HELRODRAFT_95427 [Helobdella robusta]
MDLDFIDSFPNCAKHRETCYLKTGVSNPNSSSYLKSYFICSNKNQCDFVQEANHIKPERCSVHQNNYLELRAYRQEAEEMKMYYRCTSHKQLNKPWCGRISKTIQLKPQSKVTKQRAPDRGTEVKEPEMNVNKLKMTDLNFKNLNSKKSSSLADSKDKYSFTKSPNRYRDVSLEIIDDSSEDDGNGETYEDKNIVDVDNSMEGKKANQNNNNDSANAFSASSTSSSIIAPKTSHGATLVVRQTLQMKEDSRASHLSATTALDQNPVKKWTRDHELLLNEVKVDLKRNLNVIAGIDLSRLPDGGDRLKKQVEVLTEQLEELKIRKKESIIEVEKEDHQENVLFNKFKQSASSSTTSALKQSTILNYAVSNCLISKDSKDNNDLHGNGHFYGGRMTTSRLKQVSVATTEAIDRLHSQLESCPPPTSQCSDPKGLRISLMTHQRQALAWLTWRELQLPRGGILADDMGLGKTLTMISLVLKQKQEKSEMQSTSKTSWIGKSNRKVESGGTLIICPASLLHQWRIEIEKRLMPGLLDVLVYHGPSRRCSVESLCQFDVILTTYNIIQSEVGISAAMKDEKHTHDLPAVDETETTDWSTVLLAITWERIILDEGHNIKNPKSLTALSICRLRSRIRWVMTGTPIHNNLLDMYSLLRFLRCSPFDEFRFWKNQVDNKSELGTQRLNTLIKALMLRRTKEDISIETGKPIVNLPPKKVESHVLELSKGEKLIYDRIFNISKVEMLKYMEAQRLKSLGHSNEDLSATGKTFKQNAVSLDDSAIASRSPAAAAKDLNRSNLKPKRMMHILSMILRLRQACCHLYLMKQAPNVDDLKCEGVFVDLENQMSMLSVENLLSSHASHPASSSASSTIPLKDVFEIDYISTKMNKLLTMLVDIKNSSKETNQPAKSVIVSQWTLMLEVVEHHLNKKKIRCCTIRGDVSPRKRSGMVETFNNDPKGPEVMLLSLRAGGVGLNLIGGNHLFIIDMHWNPALEQQACDRIYRVGQTKNVFIHRFVCKDTIEDKIVQLQNKKLMLSKDILSGSGSSAINLTLQDFRLLFGIGSEDNCYRFDRFQNTKPW